MGIEMTTETNMEVTSDMSETTMASITTENMPGARDDLDTNEDTTITDTTTLPSVSEAESTEGDDTMTTVSNLEDVSDQTQTTTATPAEDKTESVDDVQVITESVITVVTEEEQTEVSGTT